MMMKAMTMTTTTATRNSDLLPCFCRSARSFVAASDGAPVLGVYLLLVRNWGIRRRIALTAGSLNGPTDSDAEKAESAERERE